MTSKLGRRSTLVALGFATAACATRRGALPAAESRDRATEIARIEAAVGGRVGVFALDTESGRTLAHRADERFAMCSTFKWALAAAVLARVDRAEVALDERVAYGQADLLEYAPSTRAHLAEGAMRVEDLVRAAVVVSDNTAANLLLAKIGGPEGLTRFFRALGDDVTRLDRDEPSLNENRPGDARDTTSPRAMITSMRAALVGEALSPASRARLLEMMRACETGRRRLRAGLPTTWAAGDKTGTGTRGALHDVAIALPPGRRPILVAAYLSDSASSAEQLERAHAEIGRLVGLIATPTQNRG